MAVKKPVRMKGSKEMSHGRQAREGALMEVPNVLRGEVDADLGRYVRAVKESTLKVVLAMEKEVLMAKPLDKEHCGVLHSANKEHV